ncbi:hypothetical protein G6N74_29485 [Mesorhizobium sp. CGMCC 1.15528]|uniref:Uncharacterized protein n=1 Tax=Mesorhizobium zhangyense TaxID=1776730 RepID=A0A7C9VGX3_9HYPH|nr:hypothetical protein [Mesorhizobium zhangyense]NGN45189.1 hypothetical protein [Mesorhizobium zhangyense]
MARFFAGRKTSGGGGAVKVMKDNADNPNTTPNTDFGKFLFNSETQDIGYITGLWSIPFSAFQSSGSTPVYGPAGSTSANALYYTRFLGNRNGWFSVNRIFGAPPYSFNPMIEIRLRQSNGRYSAGASRYTTYDTGSNSGVHVTAPGYVSRGGVTEAENGWTPGGWVYYNTAPAADSGGTYVHTVWELPCDNVAVGSPTATPVVGQCNVRINPTTTKVSRPGFDVGSATGRQLILDSDRVYAKVLKADEITIAAGGTATITSPVPIPATAYLDWNWYFTGGSVIWPPATTGQVAANTENGLEYSISGSTVTVYNTGGESITVRYMLCADSDDTVPSIGGSEVYRMIGNDVQIKVPGSSDSSPKLRDILLDTRFSYIPIIAEGWITPSDCTESATSTRFGNKAKTISFTNTGFTPFVKMIVKQNSSNTGLQYREPRSRMLVFYGSSGLNWTQGAEGTVAQITNSSVKFHMATGAPTWINPTSPNSGIYDSSDDPLGIRYYIFGIPTSL